MASNLGFLLSRQLHISRHLPDHATWGEWGCTAANTVRHPTCPNALGVALLFSPLEVTTPMFFRKSLGAIAGPVHFAVLTYTMLSLHAAFVRVRPAFAGEGRYFVRVPVGK